MLPLQLAILSEEARMIDESKRGLRCRAKTIIRTPQAQLSVGNEGTILHEVDNLGRRLILVKWDDDSTLYVFPDEIEISERP